MYNLSKITDKNMKKIIMCLTVVLLMAACNNRSEDQNNNTNASGEQLSQSEMTTSEADDTDQSQWMQQSTIMSSKPMVIDFYATWCGPCKELAPLLDEIEQGHKGEVIFKRLDVDQETELAQEFNIQAIPTLMFVTPKGEYQTLVGLQERDVIESKISELLSRSSK